MGWYFVTKRIGGRAYRYKQKTYREGGKVRTQCEYVGPISDSEGGGQLSSQMDEVAVDEIIIGNPFERVAQKEEINIGNPFETRPKAKGKSKFKKPHQSVLSFSGVGSRQKFSKRNISVTALSAEYERVGSFIENLGIERSSFPKFKIKEGGRIGWRQRKSGFVVSIGSFKDGQGRNQFKQSYRTGLAKAMLDTIRQEKPFLYDSLRTTLDRSYFNSKMVITQQLLKSNEKGKIGLTLQFLWSGSLPQSLENRFGKSGKRPITKYKPASWEDGATEMIADVIKRGYKPAFANANKQKKKAKANAKRAFKRYYKMGRFTRLTSKGRKVWKRYKKHEASYLVANQNVSRIELIKPFLSKMHS